MSVSANVSIESGNNLLLLKVPTFSKFLYKVLTFLICLFFSNEECMQIDYSWSSNGTSVEKRRKNKSQTTSRKSKHSLKQIQILTLI